MVEKMSCYLDRGVYTSAMVPKHTLFTDFFLTRPAKKYTKGEVIFDYNAYVPEVFYIEKGYVRTYSISPSGREKLYVFYQPNDMFPIVWVFNNENKQLFYEAMDTVIVRSVPRDEFMTFIKDKPDVLMEVIHRIVDRHSVYVDRVDNLCHPNGRKRVIKLFLSLAKRFGKVENGGVLLQIPITHTDIAASTAMTRESASRDIEMLQRKEIIAKHNNLFFVPSMQNLEDELHKSKEELSIEEMELENKTFLSVN